MSRLMIVPAEILATDPRVDAFSPNQIAADIRTLAANDPVYRKVGNQQLPAFAKAEAALRRVGFNIGQTSGAAELVDMSATDGPGMVGVRFHPNAGDSEERWWSGPMSNLLEILGALTTGEGGDERLVITFFVTAGDLATALSIDAAARVATWNRTRVIAEIEPVPAALEEEKPKVRALKKLPQRGAVRR